MTDKDNSGDLHNVIATAIRSNLSTSDTAHLKDHEALWAAEAVLDAIILEQVGWVSDGGLLYTDGDKARNPNVTLTSVYLIQAVTQGYKASLKAMADLEYKAREEVHALRSLLSQACSAYANEYGDELSRETLDNILTIIAPKRLAEGSQNEG